MEHVEDLDPKVTGRLYSGGEPELEVSDVGQAEMAAAILQMQETLNFINAKLAYDEQLNKGTADAQALDAHQSHMHSQAYADRDEGRRARDPVLNESGRHRDTLLEQRLRHVEQGYQQTQQQNAESLNQARRQQEQGYQQTQTVSLQAMQTALTHQSTTNAIVAEILAGVTEGARVWRADMSDGTKVARDRTWTFTEQVEASTIDQLTDAVVEAIRNTPMHPDKNQTV
jgi:hypothetical protein